MTETVTVTPPVELNANMNPVGGGGDPVVLTPLEVAPGNTVLQYGVGGDLDDVEFTVYLPLRTKIDADWVDTETLVPDNSRISVRGRDCVARVSVWRSQRNPVRGGIAVLCRSSTGKAA